MHKQLLHLPLACRHITHNYLCNLGSRKCVRSFLLGYAQQLHVNYQSITSTDICSTVQTQHAFSSTATDIQGASVTGNAVYPATPAAAATAVMGHRRGTQLVDYTTLAACTRELQQAWVPAKVEQVMMSDRTTLCLKLRTPHATAWLSLSWHPTMARACIMSGAPARGDAAEAFSFAETARSQLHGLVLAGVVMPQPWERVVCLHLATRPGDPPGRKLYCEVMHKYSNVVLTSGEDTILACAYQVGGMMSRYRQLQVGRAYTLPPQLTGVPPTTFGTGSSNGASSGGSSSGGIGSAASASGITGGGWSAWRDVVTRAAALAAAPEAHQRQHHQHQQHPPAAAPAPPGGDDAGAGAASASASARGGPHDASGSSRAASGGASDKHRAVADGAARAFQGVSPYLVEELCARAGVPPSASPHQLSDSQWAALYGEWDGWLERLHSGRFAATSDQAAGRYSVLGSYPTPHPSVNAMLDAYYGPMQAAEARAQLHHRLTATVTAALKKTRGKVRSFEAQMAAAAGADAVQKEADLITANLYRIPAGAAAVEVEDWDTGDNVTLKLDPKKKPLEVAEALYKRARKLRRSVGAVAPLLEAAQREVSYLEGVEVSLSLMQQQPSGSSGDAGSGGSAEDGRALKEIQEELVQQGYLKPPPDAELAAKSAARAKKAQARADRRQGGGGAAAAGAGSGAGGERGGGGGGGSGGGGGGGGSSAGGKLPFRQFTSPNGFQVLVGRNNVQNDELSHRVAAPQDIWMHVRGLPGSHTLLRVPAGKAAPGDDDLQFAADLAAFYSKAANHGKADVVVARAKELKKPKGAKPGQVMVLKEMRNIVARPSDSAGATAAVGQAA